MSGLSAIALPHGTIPTQMFGNVNLQNAMMYVNENFKALVDGIADNVVAETDALSGKAASDHAHDDAYATIDHIHQWQDIQGLSATLDGKAELNHEHAQYLSSLPAHYHDVEGVRGLGEALQEKAEKTHAHTIQQIDGLSTELGVKASTSYVDQQVGNISNSMDTLMDAKITDKSSNIGDSQTSMGQFPDNLTQEERVLWTANGAKGATIFMIFKGEENGAGDCDLFTCKLTISKMGTITKIESVRNGGITIMAPVG